MKINNEQENFDLIHCLKQIIPFTSNVACYACTIYQLQVL